MKSKNKDKEEFVDFKHAKMLKTLGFNQECLTGYDSDGDVFDMSELRIMNLKYSSKTDIYRPTWSQAERWLYRKYGILIMIYAKQGKGKRINHWTYGWDIYDRNSAYHEHDLVFRTQFIARRKAIELVIRREYQKAKKK